MSSKQQAGKPTLWSSQWFAPWYHVDSLLPMPLPRSLDVSDDLWKFAGATHHRATLTPVPMRELEPQFIIENVV